MKRYRVILVLLAAALTTTLSGCDLLLQSLRLNSGKTGTTPGDAVSGTINGHTAVTVGSVTVAVTAGGSTLSGSASMSTPYPYDSSGSFSITNVPQGTYTVTVSFRSAYQPHNPYYTINGGSQLTPTITTAWTSSTSAVVYTVSGVTVSGATTVDVDLGSLS
jgi:hypothetical protein